MGKESRLLSAWIKETKHRFDANNRIKSFDEYMQNLAAAPYFLTRSAPHYMLDMMEHFGQEEASFFGNKIRRFKLFDADFGLETRDEQPLHGQEEPAEAIYKALENLSTEGRSDRLIHLHGPNGSSKSLLIELLMRGCEAYSKTHEGALYTFSWVFPMEAEPVTMGFGVKGEPAASKDSRHVESYAHFPSDMLQTELKCELGDNAILLIPKNYRMEVLEKLLEKAPEEQRSKFTASSFLIDGDLCPRCRMIYDALLEEYRGDVRSILRHVRVRRLYLSRRYRRGAVVISPQETPDAGSRQITMDSSLRDLPGPLQNLALTQLYGDLVDANNGLVEFSGFLTRAPELNKYLLSATERGEITLNDANLYLNLVLFATSNERHLDAFKESRDFASFKGRSILVTVPYLLEMKEEEKIYEGIVDKISRSKHLCPHVSKLASMFAVLTRLHRPTAENYPPKQKDLISGLAPLDKAQLYNGDIPSSAGRYAPQQILTLKGMVPLLRNEFRDTPIYEGRFGASPRELREVLYSAAFRNSGGCVTPIELFSGLMELIKDKSMYLFLQLKPDEAYHDAGKAIETLIDEYMLRLDSELLFSTRLIPEKTPEDTFTGYLNLLTQNSDDKKASKATTMAEAVGKMLAGGTKTADLRKKITVRIDGWRKSFPNEEPDPAVLFSKEIKKLGMALFKANSKKLEKICNTIASADTEAFDKLPANDRKSAQGTIENMVEHFGYCPECMPKIARFYLSRRFAAES